MRLAPVMPSIIPTVAAELANGVRDTLRQGAAIATGNQGEYIANGQPRSIYGKVRLAAARQVCRRYADSAISFTGPASVLAESTCRPYLDDIGYGQPPTIAKPFNGGQCAINYFVQYSYNTVNTDGSPGGTFSPEVGPILGPIRGIERRGSPGSYTAVITSGDGVESVVNSSSAPQGGLENLKIVQIFAAGGGSGPDCGNPPPVIVPPTPPPLPGPRREPFVELPDINVDIEVEVNPDLTIDVDFGTGPITIDPFGDGPSGGGDGGGSPPGDIGSPGTPEDTGSGGDAEGEAPEGSVLTGLRVDFVESPVGGKEYAPGIYRGVCYIYMGTAAGLDHDPAGAMLRSGQFVFAEQPNLTRWAVSANLGFSLRITPYYRPVEAEE